MNTAAPGLAREYESILHRYLAEQEESSLHEAYEFGREALAANLGLLQVVGFHEAVLLRILTDGGLSERFERTLRLAQNFLLEALSAFEMSQRQSQDARVALSRLTDTLETEVKRIANSLHDEAAQLLVSADLAIDEVGRGLPVDARSRLEKIRAPLRQCADELRRLSHELRPPILDELGLVPALEFLAQGISSRSGLQISVVGSVSTRFRPEVEAAVYRAVKEALANIAKHARASSATVVVRQTGSHLECSVTDDGTGFDPAQASGKGAQNGLGLIAMRERLNAVGGGYQLVTSLGKGTKLLVTVPLGEAYGHTRSAR